MAFKPQRFYLQKCATRDSESNVPLVEGIHPPCEELVTSTYNSVNKLISCPRKGCPMVYQLEEEDKHKVPFTASCPLCTLHFCPQCRLDIHRPPAFCMDMKSFNSKLPFNDPERTTLQLQYLTLLQQDIEHIMAHFLSLDLDIPYICLSLLKKEHFGMGHRLIALKLRIEGSVDECKFYHEGMFSDLCLRLESALANLLHIWCLQASAQLKEDLCVL
ncbi:unnamed protein product [Microthlaspi erraticum]|uniref:IBR domain-containing protein n=1 Tax=Microthlaspi erraticum TaxID=1685480 RepID=A0A6D2JA59_9BRAS|nr:unnamed protein product [Microthlaspi erraticum]